MGLKKAEILDFNPRPPCGGRRRVSPFSQGLYYFNPRPPCGGRPLRQRAGSSSPKSFQSTPSVWRATSAGRSCSDMQASFQSTPSVWRATPRDGTAAGQNEISIHALRVEGDYRHIAGGSYLRHFNPRPPCGGRRSPRSGINAQHYISIHALRVEGDAGSELHTVAT